MKKISKLLVAVIISTCVLAFMPGNNCLAMAESDDEVRTIKVADTIKPAIIRDGGGGSKASSAASVIDGVKADETGSDNYSSLQGTIGKLLGFLQIASALISVLVLAYTGFNYIVGTPDIKDEMKKKGVPIIVGFVLVFGATSIAKFLVGVAA